MKRGLKEVKKGAKKAGKGFIWHSLRIAFYLMILVFLISFLVSSLILNILFLILLLFIIIVSIVHLTKYSEKAFAITALSIAIVVLLLYIIGISVAVR